MKKLIIIILTILSSTSYSQKINLGLAISNSKNENISIIRSDNLSATYSIPNIMIRTQLRFNYKDFTIKSDVYSYMDMESINKYLPGLNIYDIELGYIPNKYDKFKLSLTHRCIHPSLNRGNLTSNQIFGGYDYKISLEWNIK